MRRGYLYMRGILSLLVAALSLGLPLAAAPPELPSTPAGKVLAGYLEALNSGNKDKLEAFIKAHRLELKTLQDYVKLYGERDLQFEPGTKWEYSNYGFLLLGVLIEKVSGKSYYDFVAENIYKVAGMTNSGSEPESVEVANRSKGYMRHQFEMVSNEPTLPWRGTSAGGGYTTAAELMKFAGALMSNKLLKAETLAEATRPQFTTGAYGFGFQIGRPDEARTYGHGGGAPGMNAILRVYPESGPARRDDRAGQPGRYFGFAHGRLPPRPHATQVVPTTGDAAVEKTRRNQAAKLLCAEVCGKISASAQSKTRSGCSPDFFIGLTNSVDRFLIRLARSIPFCSPWPKGRRAKILTGQK